METGYRWSLALSLRPLPTEKKLEISLEPSDRNSLGLIIRYIKASEIHSEYQKSRESLIIS